MTPVSSSPGWITRKPNATTAPTVAGPDFTTQLQALLQSTKTTPTEDLSSSRATIGHLHTGGMNDVAHQLLKLSGKN